MTGLRRWLFIGAALLALCLAVWMRIAAQGGELRYGDTVSGTLKAGAADTWRFTGVAGDIIAVSVQRASGDLEPSFVLEDPAERPLAGTQAAKGQPSVSLVQVRLTQAGSYSIKLGGNGQTAGDYKLTLTLTTPAAQSSTLEPTAVSDVVAGTLTYGATAHGTLDNKVFRQLWRFRGSFADMIDIHMVATSGNLNPVLALISPLGDVIAANDSTNGGQDAGILAYQLPFTGEFTIIARRAGSGLGQNGTTTGRYDLTLSLRGPGTTAQNTLISPGTTIRGRVSEDVPQAIYRLETGGAIAATLDVHSLHRLARLRVLTTTGDVIATYRGESPLAVSTVLPDKGPFLVEVTSSNFENQPFTDFGLTVYRLNASTSSAPLLHYGDPRRATLTGGMQWFFLGRAGDIVSVEAVPDVPSLNASVRVIGPQGAVLFLGNLGPGVHQTLTLPDTGPYAVEVRPAEGESITVETIVDRIGANGVAFDRFALAAERGGLLLDAAATGKLAAGAADAWWLDATAGQVINLSASSTSGALMLGLALRGPDGALVGVQIGERTQGVALKQAVLRQTGRYQAIVFDSDGRTGGQYALRFEPVSGGDLQSGQSVKGILSPANGIASWSIDVSAGALINARLTNLTLKAWTPSLYIADPGGLIIASADAAGQGTDIDVLGIEAPVTGKYHLVVAGQVRDTTASYRLLSNVQVPFAPNANTTIQVSAVRPPLGRYAVAPTSAPIQWQPADLINPSINVKAIGASAGALPPGATIRGEVAQGVLAQGWHFDGLQNQSLTFQATSLVGSVGPGLTILDKDGKILAEQLHADDPTTVLTYRVVRSGVYTIVVSMGLNGGRYLLSLNTVNVTNGPLQIAAGSPIMYGQNATGEILTGDKTDAYYFLGANNDVITLQLARTAGDLVAGLQLRSPQGAVLIDEQNGNNNALLVEPALRLPESGIYALVVGHGNSATSTTGRYALYLGLDGARVLGRGGGIITSGATVSGSLFPTRTDDTWLLQGHAGERVTLIAAGLGDPLPVPLGIRLQDTAGHTFAVQDIVLTQTAARLTDIMLPADGVYRAQISGGTQTAGTYVLTWQPEEERQTVGTLHYDQTVNGVFNPQHNADAWVFSGTAGDVISVALRYVRGDSFNGGFQVRSENGLPLATVADLEGTGARTEGLLLPFSGTYTVAVANPDATFKGAGVYSLSVTLQDSKARSVGGVLQYSQQARGSLTDDDPGDTWVFSAQAGDIVRVTAKAQDQFLKPALDLRTPDGVILASVLPDSVSGDTRAATTLDKFTIPFGGTYTITVSGGPNKTLGGYLLSLDFTPPPVAPAETMRYGDTRDGLIADDRLGQRRVFSGKRGDIVSVMMTREPGSNLAPVVELRTVDGQLLARSDAANQEAASILDLRLPETGQYVLATSRYLGARGATNGRYKLNLVGVSSDEPIKGTVNYGQLAIGRLGDGNPLDRLTFNGKAGDVIGILSSAKSGDLDTVLALEDSTGNVLATNDDANGVNASVAGVLLPADGTYTVVLSRYESGMVASSGNYELYVNLLYRVNASAPPKSLVAYGQRVIGTVDLQNPEARYTFSGNQDDEIAVRLVHQTDDAPPQLSIQDPAGTSLAVGSLQLGQTVIDRFRLPASGLYTVVVKRPVNTQLSYSPFALTLNLLTSPAGQSAGGVLRVSEAVTGAFAPGQSVHYWLFEARAGQVIAVNLLQLSGDLLPSLILIGPNGQGLATAAVPERGLSVTIDRIELPADGVYSLLVVPGGPNRAGQYRLTLQPNVTATPAPPTLAPGQPVSGTLDAIHPEQRWTFSALKGQTITARMEATSGDLLPDIQLLGADGRILAEGQPGHDAQYRECVIGGFVLPASGSYTLVTRQQRDTGQTAGTFRLLLEIGSLSAQAVAAAPIAYAQPVSKVVQQGTTDYWAFNGGAGDALTIIVTADLAKGQQAPAVNLQDAGGRVLAQTAPGTSGEAVIQSAVLPGDGRYIIALPASSTVSYTLTVQRRQTLLADSASPRPLVADRPLDGAIAGKVSAEYWTFTGKAGSVIQLTGARLSGDLRLDVTLFGPKGYVASAAAPPDNGNVTLGPLRLPDDGAYIVVATRWQDGNDKSAGRYTLKLTLPSGISGSAGGAISAFGQPMIGAITAADDGDTWAFDGQAGDVLNIRMTRLDGTLQPSLTVTAPGSSQALASGSDANGDLILSRVALPMTGHYTIVAGHLAQTTGAYRLTVERIQSAIQASISGATGIRYGDDRQGELTEAAPVQAWVFFGKAGENISVEAVPGSGSSLDPYLYILAPDGKVLRTDDNSGGATSAKLVNVTLPGDGFYGIVVAASPLSATPFGTFSISLHLGQPGAAYQGRITVGGDVTGTLDADQPVQEWAFEASEAKSVTVTVNSPSVVFNSGLSIVASDGRVLVAPTPASNGTLSLDVALPGPGQYAILLSARARGAQGRYNLSLRDAAPGTH